MQLPRSKIFLGWFVVIGAVVVTFGVSGAQFSFGVFMKPMTEAFGWDRATLSLAFGITFMISGLLRPLAGYLADRYSPKMAVLAGVVVMGVILLLIPFIQNQAQLYVLFAILAIGVTLGMGPIMTKIVSSWFYTNRGLMLGLVSGAGSLGGMVLVPGSSLFLVLSDWKPSLLVPGPALVDCHDACRMAVAQGPAPRMWASGQWGPLMSSRGKAALPQATKNLLWGGTLLSAKPWGAHFLPSSRSGTSFEGTR